MLYNYITMKRPDKAITTTYLPKITLNRLRVYAAKNNRSLSDVMDKSVNSYIDQKPTKPVK